MAEYIISLTLLIAAHLVIRKVFRKTVSPRVIYALWLVVVVRLCLPFSLFSVVSPWTLPHQSSIAEESYGAIYTPPTPSAPVEAVDPTDSLIPQEGTIPSQNAPQQPTEPSQPSEAPPTTQVIEASTPTPSAERDFDVRRACYHLWMTGAVAVALWFAAAGGIFQYRLHKSRRLYQQLRKSKVYVSDYVGSPCLAGLIPAIYIPSETVNSKSETLVIVHEYIHLLHLDHIWSVLRVLAVAVHWWNPIVWLGAIASGQDSELACDDTVAAKLSEKKRLEYAHILLDSVPQKRTFAPGFRSAPLKERLIRLTKVQKNRVLCVVLAALLAVTAAGCSFVTLTEKPNDGTESETGEMEASETDSPDETDKPGSLDEPESTITAVDMLPMAPSKAIITAYPMGGNPGYYVFAEGLTYYRKDADGATAECTLRLPKGYTEGKIIRGSAGVGSGEVHLLVEAWYHGSRAYLSYLFSDAEGDSVQPASITHLTDDALIEQRNTMSYRHSIPIYDCMDTNIYADLTTYGTATAWIPTALTDYEITEFNIFSCIYGCDSTELFLRQHWGGGIRRYSIDEYEEYTKADGWKHRTRRYLDIAPEDVIEQGLAEDTSRKYEYLVFINDNHYAYIVIEPKPGTVAPENETDIVNEFMKLAEFTVEAKDTIDIGTIEAALDSYTVTLDLNEANRETLFSAGTYGSGQSYSHGSTFAPGTDGVRYEIIGIGSHFHAAGYARELHTYRVESYRHKIISVEEVETVTKDIVRAYGKPYTGDLDGLYYSTAYSKAAPGNIGRAVLIEGNRINVSAFLSGTDAGGTYRGTYQYDETTGRFTAELIYRVASNGEITISDPRTLTGLLLEYNGFVHFLCESYDFPNLKPEEVLPLIFVPNINGSMDPPAVKFSSSFYGEWSYVSSSVKEGARIQRVYIDTETGAMELDLVNEDGALVNSYRGTVSIDSFHYTRAVLYDENPNHSYPEIHLEFTLGYSVSFDGTFMWMHFDSCNVEKYGHLVGQSFTFTH